MKFRRWLVVSLGFAFIFAAGFVYRLAAKDDFIVTQFRIATAQDGSVPVPVGLARWKSSIAVSISGPDAVGAPVGEVSQEFSEISQASGIQLNAIGSEKPNFGIHYSKDFQVNDLERQRLAAILQKDDVNDLVKSLSSKGNPCYVQVRVLNGSIVGAIIFADTSKGQAANVCVRANIMAAFGFPLYPRLDKNLDSILTGKTGRSRILTNTDVQFLSALYADDPIAAKEIWR